MQNFMFDVSKNNEFDTQHGFKIFIRRLRVAGFKVTSNKEDINSEILSQATVLVIALPKSCYSESELNHLKKYVASGGKVWIMMGEGGDRKQGSNINALIESLGITVNNDCVIRNSYYKYFHPKEALITNGILNRGILNAGNRVRNLSNTCLQTINYVYPFGATLNVVRPSIGVMSTGSVCYPLNRPTIAFYINTTRNQTGDHSQSDGHNLVNKNNASNDENELGKIVVTGSCQMFTDNYIEKEDNALIKDIIIEFITQTNFPLDQIDAVDPEIIDYHCVTDIGLVAEEPLSCLYETEDAPSDHTKLFSKDIYSIDNNPLARVIDAYNEFNMVREPLKLIKPQFELPLPPLEPAVFPPNLRIPSRPLLELFDLDLEFSSTASRLNQIANKCSDSDIEYYVRECALVLGIPEAEKMSAKEIVEYVFSKILLCKKVNNE